MNRAQILKKLLPGFIPLFVFIAADEIWGTKIGLFVAIGVGVAEMTWIAIKEKRFEKFVLFDTLLLVILGGVSILLDNDIFFKLKPGLIELILVAILAISAFSKINIVGLMGQRYMKDVAFNSAQMQQMRKSMKAMFFIFLVHTILVLYSAFYMSKEAWAFISGGLFYIIFGVYFLYELLRQKRKQKALANEEWVPLVDEQGKVTGQAPRSQVHNGSKLLHPVVHLHVLNKKGSILIQKRPVDKQIQPGKWDTAVGGHISAGETLEQALKKEAFEEIGLKEFSAKLQKVYKWESEVEAELIYLFTTYDYKGFGIQSNEVDELRFWTKKQVAKNLGKDVFTPNFEVEFKLLQELKLI
ncbi:NUDIX domain-containing protein [Draconibacterium halophilum]|uniref:NUDIX domain-containing protein n=1 Tax=Draconibacterium halophilum TaxID=2706887 RepID=A0A6C0RCY0_9BACT|nr:NUDIX domain-containing protein [Draconibacterium halophilum]QIA08354.1 NUDIX domain-containing protein [Draconibacterium halophilum]